MKRLVLFGLVAAIFGIGCCAARYVTGYSTVAPPPIRVETYGLAPGTGFIWIQGYWSWRSNTYLDDLKSTLDNQYLLEFDAIPGTKSGLRYVRLSTEVAGVELNSADAVWVEVK